MDGMESSLLATTDDDDDLLATLRPARAPPSNTEA